MRKLRVFLAAFFAFGAVSAHAQQLPPPEAYGRLPAIGSASISPDGRHLILFTGDGDTGRVAIHRIESNSFPVLRIINAPAGGSIRGVDFADNRYALVTISQTFDPERATASGASSGGRAPVRVGRRGVVDRADSTSTTEYFRQLTIDITNGDTAFMLSNQRYQVYISSLGAVVAPISGDEGYGRALSYDFGGPTPAAAVHRVNLETGASYVTHRGSSDTQQFCMDAAGTPYARLDYDEAERRWSIFAVEGSSARRVFSETVADDEEWRIGALACRVHGRAPNFIAVSGYGETGDRYVVRSLDLSTGTMSTLFEQEDFDAYPIRDPHTREVVGYGWTGVDAGQVEFFEPQLRSIYDRMRQRLSGAPFQVLGWDQTRERFVVAREIAGRGPATLLYEASSNEVRLIGYDYPELEGTQIPERLAINYRARDGVRIPAFLTLPPGVENPRGIPLVVMPHGGPHANNVRGFDWWAAFMATRGYAVLEPDFRGSTGYGRAWEEAGHGNWGNGVMQHDLTDGVAAMVRAGIADPRRVCIVGASYGGYAALAGVTFTPDVYACAVSVAGVSDLRRMFRRELRVAGADSPTTRFWSESMGEENFDRDSPSQHVAAIHAPVLMIHGAHDTVVPFDQSTWMVERMREAGKDVRLVELNGDDHWLSDAPTRIQMLRELEAFLAEHIGGDAPAGQ